MPDIKFNVSKSAIKGVVSEIAGYTKVLKEKGAKLIEDLAEFARDDAQQTFNEADYDGVKDAKVRVEKMKNGVCKIIAEGESVYFLEYGTGVHYTEEYPGEIPEGVLGRGEYGSKNGANDYWWFSPDPGEDNLTSGGDYATYKVKEWYYTDGDYFDPETGRKLKNRGREEVIDDEGKTVFVDVTKDNSIITYGNPPCAAMYIAYEIMKDEALDRVEELLDD